MSPLTKELLDFCNTKMVEVDYKPENDIDRGYRISAVLFVSKVKQILHKYDVDVPEFDDKQLIKLMDEKLQSGE